MATATTIARPEDMGETVGTGVLQEVTTTEGEAVHYPQMRQEAECRPGSKIAGHHQ